jgi:hypothetical protein
LLVLFLLLVALIVAILVTGGSNPGTTQRALPISYEYPTATLSWQGFKIHADSCRVVSGSSGFARATLKGTAVVPIHGTGVVTVGQIEAWILDSSGQVIAQGTPWPLPKSGGQYNWTIQEFTTTSATPASCVVQGVNTSYPYGVPQTPSSPAYASVDPN